MRRWMRQWTRRRGRQCECWELGTGQPRTLPGRMVEMGPWGWGSRRRQRAQRECRMIRTPMTLVEESEDAEEEEYEVWEQGRHEVGEGVGTAEEEEEGEKEEDRVQRLRRHPA